MAATVGGPDGRWLGLDLGGTKAYGVSLHGGRVVQEAKRKTPLGGSPADVVAALVRLVDDLGGARGVAGIGVGAPGPVDHRSGIVRQAPNLSGWHGEVPLAELLAAQIGRAVVVDNDVNCGTVAEQRLGGAAGEPHVLGVFVGTGVGGGLVLDGRLFRGAAGGAGEIGHLAVRPDGALCGCGRPGHLEAYAGRAGMEREARRRHAQGEATVLVDLANGQRMKSSVWERALEAGDQVARSIVDECTEMLGVAVSSTVALLDVSVVVIGGGMADRLGEPFIGAVRAALGRRLFGDPPVRLVPARLGDRAGAVGAALLAAEAAAAGTVPEPGGPPTG